MLKVVSNQSEHSENVSQVDQGLPGASLLAIKLEFVNSIVNYISHGG